MDKDLSEQAAEFLSLEFLNIERCQTEMLHPMLQDASSQLDIKKMTVKLQLLVQRYALSTSRTAGNARSDRCPLCSSEPETTTHFLLQCSTLHPIHIKYLPEILNKFRKHQLPIDLANVVKIILDCTFLPDDDKNFERLCKNFVYKLHHTRAILLGGVSAYKNL